MKSKIVRISIVLCLYLLLSLTISHPYAKTFSVPPPISGRNPNTINHIIPADVLSRVKLLGEELNLIRKALGQPSETHTLISVTQASPREVYFEAQALLEKANRLNFEITGNYRKVPPIHSQNLQPTHVLALVNNALISILSIKSSLDIKTTVNEILSSQNTTPTEVFNAILVVNSQINGLLTSPISSKDVYEEVTLAVNYTANLLKHFDVIPRIPQEPVYVQNITMKQAYLKLVKCFDLIRNINEKAGIDMLKINMDRNITLDVTSNDLYDLSKIIVSEVYYLNTFIDYNNDIASYDPGYKIPSDIYQRLSLLEKQLEMLLLAVDKNPNGLKRQ